jgi:hypothetical protein
VVIYETEDSDFADSAIAALKKANIGNPIRLSAFTYATVPTFGTPTMFSSVTAR